MIINLGCASADNHIPRDDIFDYHPLRECNIYIILMLKICSTRDKMESIICRGIHICLINTTLPFSLEVEGDFILLFVF